MIGGVYFAYPIDQRGTTEDLAYLWRQIEFMKSLLFGGGLATWAFDPGDAFRVNPYVTPVDTLDRINRAALANSDVVVAFLPAGIVSIGVPIEIDRAFSMGKHVVIFTNAKSWSLTAYANRSRVARYGAWDDEAIKDAVEWLKQAEPAPDPYQAPHKEMRVRLDHPNAQMPKRTYDSDAGLDLTVCEDTVVPAGGFADVPCGLSLELPERTWGLVTGRSSALRKRGLLVHSGIIDEGYRGPIYAGAWNQTAEDVTVKVGERIAQLIINYNDTSRTVIIPVDQLNESPRGERGFGSSGS